MVMGVFTSTATMAAGNNGTARFTAPLKTVCSIVPDNHKLEVDMGDMGPEKLKNNGTTTPKSFQIGLQDCVFDTQETMTTTFTGTFFLLQIAAIITPFSIPIPVRHLTMLHLAIGHSLDTTKAAWVLTKI